MKLQVKQAGGGQALTIGSQKEFLQLWNRGVIAADDLVRRGDRWVPAAELPWIRQSEDDAARCESGYAARTAKRRESDSSHSHRTAAFDV